MEKPREVARERAGRRVRKDAPHEAIRRKLTLVLSDETYRRLSVYSLMTGVDRSQVVTGLVDDHCKRWVVQDRGGPSPAAGAASPDGGEKGAVEDVPGGQDGSTDVDAHPTAGEGGPPPRPRPGRRGQAAAPPGAGGPEAGVGK